MLVGGCAAFAAGCASVSVTVDPVYFPAAPSRARAVHLKSFNTLRELVPVPTSFVDRVRGKASAPSMGTPAGLAFRAGHLYVCDTLQGVVLDWDLAAGSARQLGSSGAGALTKPVAVAVDQYGNIYVADTQRSEVVGYDADGVFVRAFKPLDRARYRPVAVAVWDERLYVADIAEHRIDIYSTLDGALIDGFGRPGSEPGSLYFPMGLAVDGDGGVFVSDMMNSRVQRFDADRRVTRSMGRPGNRFGDMGKPRHLAVGPDGVLFVADAEFAHVHLYDPTGRLLMLIGGPEDAPGGTPMPVGLAVARELPTTLRRLIPDGFSAEYFLFVANTVGTKRLSLFAIGAARSAPGDGDVE